MGGKKTQDAISQNSEDQKGVGEEAEAESAHPAVDPNADGQHDPLQRQKASLEKNQAQALNPSNVPLRPFRHRDIDGEVTKRRNMASVYRLSEARINELLWLIRYAGENGRRWLPQRNCFCFLNLRILCQIIESYIIFVPSYFFDKTFVELIEFSFKSLPVTRFQY